MAQPEPRDEAVPDLAADDDTGPRQAIVLPRAGKTTDSTDDDSEPPPEAA